MTTAPILAYVAGPYRDPRGPFYIRENIRRAEAVAVELWKRGIPALCPHLNTALMDGIAPDQVFLDGDLLMLSRCDVVILAGDWLRSRGTLAEVNYADAHGIRVIDSAAPEYQAWLQATATFTEALR